MSASTTAHAKKAVYKMERGSKYVDDETFCVHPDTKKARKGYKGNGTSFTEMFRERDRLLEEGQPFWNTDHDVEMTETARQRSMDYELQGNVWPTRNGRKGRSTQ